MVGAAEEILAGPEYFRCERFRCRMKKSACVEQQEARHQRETASGKTSEWPVHPECQGCEQGIEMMKEMGKTITPEQGRPVVKSHNDIATKVCKTCNKEKAIKLFPPNAACKDGYEGTCKKCRSDQAKDRWRNRKQASVDNGAPLCTDCGERPATMKNGKPVNGKCGHCMSKIMSKAAKKKKATRKPKDGEIELTILTLGVGHYPEIIEELEQAARINIRTIEHQALAYIVKGLKADGYGNGDSDLK